MFPMVVDVAVSDSAGHPIRDLERADLTLLDRGVRQPIEFFEEVNHPAISESAFPETLTRDVADNRMAASSRPARDKMPAP